MKTIGLIGGVSWKSFLNPYRIINDKNKNIQQKIGWSELTKIHTERTVLEALK